MNKALLTSKSDAPSPADARETYTVEEAAAVLGISRGSAYAAVNRGEIPSVRINRRLLVPRGRLHQLLNAEPALPQG